MDSGATLRQCVDRLQMRGRGQYLGRGARPERIQNDCRKRLGIVMGLLQRRGQDLPTPLAHGKEHLAAEVVKNTNAALFPGLFGDSGSRGGGCDRVRRRRGGIGRRGGFCRRRRGSRRRFTRGGSRNFLAEQVEQTHRVPLSGQAGAGDERTAALRSVRLRQAEVDTQGTVDPLRRGEIDLGEGNLLHGLSGDQQC